MSSWQFWTVAAAIVLCAAYATARYLEPEHDAREPPLIRPRIPLIGHGIGLYRYGPKYFMQTSRQTTSPIYTVPILGMKNYIVTSNQLCNLVSRSSKSISFNPFIAELGMRMTASSPAARAIIEKNIDGSEGKDSYVVEVHDQTIAGLAPSDQLNHITVAMLRPAWSRYLQPLETRTSKDPIPFYMTLRHILSYCSPLSFYGQQSPFVQDPTAEQAFWEYNAGLNMLLVNMFPQWTCPTGYKAREQLAHAYKEYFETAPHPDAAELANLRWRNGCKSGLSTLDMGRLEVGTTVGILVNTVPTIFYMLFHIYSDPLVLEAVRDELRTAAVTSSSTAESTETMNLSAVRTQCLLLASIYQETLRAYSYGASARFVLEDTLLDNRYLLKKGSVVQMPNSVMHRDSRIWGNVEFDTKRFYVPHEAGGKDPAFPRKAGDSKNTPAALYRPFGGGSTLCPGRHYATMEVLGLAAMIIWRFDILPTSGEWILPKPAQGSIVEAVFPPSSDINVHFQPRASAGTKFELVVQ